MRKSHIIASYGRAKKLSKNEKKKFAELMRHSTEEQAKYNNRVEYLYALEFIWCNMPNQAILQQQY
jgi:hypothetical protein